MLSIISILKTEYRPRLADALKAVSADKDAVSSDKDAVSTDKDTVSSDKDAV